ncbi:heme A synthase [Roseivivax sediminis]|uniref:Heme A synthase n=1 Tax=Roseivivax sediminis TaxID=936889 RepID=A0A1I1YUN3_9RHOB|nr:heme A synthase [Roseivivax sediminis]SFE21740.1 cytochrome c oxidase assembly protein subunit 15 [Roseivivax sediminis]
MAQKPKRKLFEDVGEGTAPRAEAPKGGMIDAGRRGARGAVRAWLMVLFALVMVMIAVGGLTRLTDSGLSITEWNLVTGAVPPLDQATWEAEFEKYQRIPQFELLNPTMTLDEFKTIYWWEWGHRQLGRVIGLVWAVGFLGFLVTRTIPPGWAGRLLGLGALGGLQGAIGWWMVSSGLGNGMISVASYRLAVHLGLAFVILGLIAWYVFRLGRESRELMQARRAREGKLFSMSTGLMHFAFLQILLGALVAGIDAGRTYTDWPLMSGGIFPPTPFEIEPVWRNFFENAGLVQFMHRIAGYLLFVFGIVVWARSRRSPHAATRFRFNAVFAMMVIQMLLGIATVLYGATWQIAIVHQVGAVALWVLILRARFGAAYPAAQSLRGTR